jgi:hypothetical protein
MPLQQLFSNFALSGVPTTNLDYPATGFLETAIRKGALK